MPDTLALEELDLVNAVVAVALLLGVVNVFEVRVRRGEIQLIELRP